MADTSVFSSDEQYAEELQTQEAIAASLKMSHLHMSSTIQDAPESSQGFCEICMDTKGANEMFKLENCSYHTFCSECIGEYVKSRIPEKRFPVTCPGSKCSAIIQPASCRSIIPEDAFARWEEGLAESTILPGEIIYCPYGDCSATFTYDPDEKITKCTCFACEKPFCVQCQAPWHDGRDCEKFLKEEKRINDSKLEELAKESNWKRCPHCGSMVNKVEGCIHMTCNCKREFCFVCGGKWSKEHWDTCQE